jgi:hypothetical protein
MVYASSGTHLNMPEDALSPGNGGVQPDTDISQLTGPDETVSTSTQMVVVPQTKVLRKVSIVKARRVSRVHEAVAVVVALGGLGAGYLAWRLSVGTISIGAASPLVESALERIVGGETKIGALRLGWDDTRREFVVTATDITATTDARTSPLALGRVNLTLDARALLSGRAQITNANLSGLQAVLVIDKQGRTAFGFGTAQEVLKLPRSKRQARSLRDLIDTVRKAVMPNGAQGRVEAIALNNASLIVIDPETGERLTLANARASVTTNADSLVTMQAAGAAVEMGGFGDVSVSASPDVSQKLVLVANFNQTRLDKLPASLRQGPLARLSRDTAALTGKVNVQLGDQPKDYTVQADFKLGPGRFQGFDVQQASGALVFEGSAGKGALTNFSATTAQGNIANANGSLGSLRNGIRQLAFDANSIAFANAATGSVSAGQVQGGAQLRADFRPVSGVLSAGNTRVSQAGLANLQADGLDIAFSLNNRRADTGVVLSAATPKLTGNLRGRDVSGMGIVAKMEGVRNGQGFLLSQIEASANRFMSSLDLRSGPQNIDIKDLNLTASQFASSNGNRLGVPSSGSITASTIDLGGSQSGQLSARASGVAVTASGLGGKNARAAGTIASLNSAISGARAMTASTSSLRFDATQISSNGARFDLLAAQTLNLVGGGGSLGTTGISASGTLLGRTFNGANIGADRVEINHPTQLPQPFWADDLRLRGNLGPATAALDAFAFRHSGVDLGGKGTIALAPKGSPRVTLDASVQGPFSVQTLLSAWPRRFLPDTRGAITRLVPSGTAQVTRLSLAIPAGMRPKQILPRSAMDLAFNLKDLTITYLPGMSPITNVSGEGVLRGNSLLINLPRGFINDIALSEGVVEIAPFKARGAVASIRARVDGNVIDMAREIDLPPLAILSKANFAADRLSGVGTANLDLAIPLKANLNPDDIGVKVVGDFEEAGLMGVFAGLDAVDAFAHLTVDNDALEVSGSALVSGNEFDYHWASTPTPNAPPQIILSATGQVSVDDLAAIGLDLGAYATGLIGLDVQSNSEGAQFGAAVIKADLLKTNITLPGQLWSKPEGVAALATANLYPREGSGWNVQDLRFDSGGALLRGALDISDDAKLVDARFSRIFIPNAGDLAVNVTPADTGLTVTLRGDYLNLTPYLQTQNVSEKAVDLFDRPLNLSADINRVATSQTNTITNVHADIVRDQLGWRTLSAKGDTAAGNSQIKLMIERDGRRSVSGAVSDAGFFAQLLYPGAPLVGGSGTIEGELPVVGANSSGVLTFTGKDITLARKGAPPVLFENVQMPMSVRGGVVTLRDGQANGLAYTVKASGYVDVGAGRLDLRGVATPGGLNRALGDIPLFGAILGGGANEGLLGITFAAKGNMAAPRISINPVSAFAPGFLRKLFESEPPLSPQPRLLVTTLAGDPIITKWPYGPTEDMSELGSSAGMDGKSGPAQ